MMKKFFSLALCAAALLGALALSPAIAADGAPIAENLELATYRNVSVGGRLAAADAEDDAVTFEITTQPKKGDIELQDDGSFVYTPRENKKGRDYFDYRATDSEGNVSQEATVIITISKQKTGVTYSDMSGSGSEYAAAALAESGVYTGALLGGSYVFEPSATLTRGQFLMMCMSAADVPLLSGVLTTGFADDADIPAAMKPYVSTALHRGIVSGTERDGQTVFAPNEPITGAEAAVILDRCFALTTVSLASAADEAAPVWAAQSAANISECGILSYDAAVSGSALSRAECAEMLVSAMAVAAKR
ncbi:MAG: S-layer homology domain-containing protein [Oscillospiraceae bacterium]|nr:S-layer homology domain-containing protein [Oscillospiraceae bacterium]